VDYTAHALKAVNVGPAPRGNSSTGKHTSRFTPAERLQGDQGALLSRITCKKPLYFRRSLRMNRRLGSLACIVALIASDNSALIAQALKNPYKPRVPRLDALKHTAPVGRLTRQLSVSELGSATYQIPIALPPGQAISDAFPHPRLR